MGLMMGPVSETNGTLYQIDIAKNHFAAWMLQKKNVPWFSKA
jgi:hypothetical protein